MNNLTRNIIVISGVAVVLGFLVSRQARAAVEAVTDVNVGTPFEGTGVIGTLGNTVNQLSGGLFERIGSAIGGGLATIREGFGGITDTSDQGTTPEDIQEQLGIVAG